MGINSFDSKFRNAKYFVNPNFVNPKQIFRFKVEGFWGAELAKLGQLFDQILLD
jgi:hypothetical protein